MSSRIASKRLVDDGDDIELTPMLDVVFIMLIFFVVTATFVMEKGLDVQRPEYGPASSTDAVPIVLNITASGEIWLAKRRIDKLSVRSNVEQLLAQDPARSVVVSTEQTTPTSVFVPVLDYARMGGATSVSLHVAE
ncbi:MAG: biopolymer transporter ExbD [Pseudomonadota bacterium]